MPKPASRTAANSVLIRSLAFPSRLPRGLQVDEQLKLVGQIDGRVTRRGIRSNLAADFLVKIGF